MNINLINKNMVVTQVSIKISEGGHNLVAIEEFASFPFDQRMNLISSKAVTFLDEDGQKVPLLEGVKFTTNFLRERNGN